MYASGDYEGSIRAFDSAIAATKDDTKSLLLLYSNRSAANLQLRRTEDAMVDARKCIALDPQWKKGHIRLGDAEYEKKKYTEAYNAYNTAKRLDLASDKSLDGKLEQAMKGRIYPSSHHPFSPTFTVSIFLLTIQGIRNSATSSTSSGSSVVQPGGIVGKIIHNTRYLIIFSAMLYLIPIHHSWSFFCYKFFVVLAAGLYLVQLYMKHGFPKFSTEYLQLVMPDPNAMNLFLATILCFSRPYFSALGPIFFSEMSNVSGDVFSYLQKNQALVTSMLNKYAPSMSHVTSEIFSPRTIQKINFALLRNAALSEVFHGIYLVVELLLPSRNLMTCMVWWQFLQMQYMVLNDTPNLPSNHLKEAFEAVHQKISSVVNHRLCPKLIARGYTMLTKVLADRIKRPQQSPSASASGLSGLMSKCTIM